MHMGRGDKKPLTVLLVRLFQTRKCVTKGVVQAKELLQLHGHVHKTGSPTLLGLLKPGEEHSKEADDSFPAQMSGKWINAACTMVAWREVEAVK